MNYKPIYLVGAAAALAAGWLLYTATAAPAADLGGNCCADLEERIAELEATTARKGNRKVSLTVTGWVSSQLYYFDDGVSSNTYVVDNANDLSSNVKFTGTAQISPGWKAGYSLLINTDGPSSLTANDQGSGKSISLSVENSYWFIQSDTLGKLSVGKQSLAADNAALGTDFSGTLFPANGVTFDGAGLRMAVGGSYTALNWGQAAFFCEMAAGGIGNDCAGGRANGVRYDTPTFYGFTIGASWGEDDYWDVALRYSGEFSGFKMAFATAYSESTDPALYGSGNSNDNQYWQVGGMIKHMPSGLWIHGTYGKTKIDAGNSYSLDKACGGDTACPDTADGWYVKGGWTTKFNTLGNTHFYGEYGKNNDAFERGTGLSTGGWGPWTHYHDLLVSTDATRYGVGVVQEIDAASMSLWVKWRHHELDGVSYDYHNDTYDKFSADSVDMFLAGAVIFY